MKTISIFLAAIFLLLAASRVPATTFYVNVSNTVPVAPYTNWPTAATNIQDAVDASTDGDFILVTNGVYSSGGRVISDGTTNRVAVIKAVTLQSASGPETTLISGKSTMRCIYLTNGAFAVGFTLTNGSTSKNGGGVRCESSSVISNCIVTGCNATNLPIQREEAFMAAIFGTA